MKGFTNSIVVQSLGQAGFRLGLSNEVVYIDPYLSHYVEEVEGPEARRLVPVALDPARVTDASCYLFVAIKNTGNVWSQNHENRKQQ